jgi:predicted AAA+ superfamily ATPase
MFINRGLTKIIIKTLKTKSILLLGPRQTGKTTLLSKLSFSKTYNLAQSKLRLKYEKQPSLFSDEIRNLTDKSPLIYVDEIQKVPDLMDEIQVLVDEKVALFCITGSSARKLKRGSQTNLLPGRVALLRLDPLNYTEIPNFNLNHVLIFGSLPAILLESNNRAADKMLRDYVELYLQEEVRAEALVRNVGIFHRFLELAAIESGRIVNFSKISKDVGVSYHTIQSYYAILEDCLIIERIDPLTESSFNRKKLVKSSKYLFFDLGVRRIAANEGLRLPREHLGLIFEQWVGLEIIRYFRSKSLSYQLKFWSDPDGPEVDWVIQFDGNYFPIEVKYSESISTSDCRHLKTFEQEYSNAKKGIIIYAGNENLTLANHYNVLSYKLMTQWLEQNFK